MASCQAGRASFGGQAAQRRQWRRLCLRLGQRLSTHHRRHHWPLQAGVEALGPLRGKVHDGAVSSPSKEPYPALPQA